MTRTIIMSIGVVALLSAPARLYAQGPSAHAGAGPHAAQAVGQARGHDTTQGPAAKPDLDALVTKMNAATGAAKVDAMAEVLTALVQKQKDCEAKMAGMMSGMEHSAKPAEPSSKAP